jgi:Putative Flp pilus-assembly TadE/G-like
MKKVPKKPNPVQGQKGAVLIIAAASLLVLFGFMALAVDVGYLLYIKNRLQSSTEVAALAGGADINCCVNSSAASTAIQYSSVEGALNQIEGIGVTMPTPPALKCLAGFQSTVSCTGYDNANAIRVVQQATVPLIFAPVIGIPSANVSAAAMASASGGITPPLNVMIVLDTTGSMNNSNPTCGSGQTRLSCALKGVQALLMQLSNPKNLVGIMTFPPMSNASQAQYQTDCSASTKPAIASTYSANGASYLLTSMTGSYLTTTGNKALSSSSVLVKAVGGVTNCPPLVAVGGLGTYFAGAIKAAQAAMPANGNQNVIIVVSDGDASSTKMGSIPATQQCQQAVTEAKAATNKGTWVYSLAYGAGATGCSTDTSPKITPCATMQALASKPSMFFSDNTGSCASTGANVINLFSQVGNSLMSPRRLPVNAQ